MNDWEVNMTVSLILLQLSHHNKVTVMFSSPTAARVLKKQDPAYLTKYDTKGAVGEVVSFSAELQVSGAVTRGTYA